MTSSPTDLWAQAEDIAGELGDCMLELEQTCADSAEPATSFDPSAQAIKNLSGRVSKLKGMVSRRTSPIQTISACSTVQSRLNSRIETGEASESEVETLVECQEVLTELVQVLKEIHEELGEREGEGGDNAGNQLVKNGLNGLPRALQVILFQFELLVNFFNKFLRRKGRQKKSVVAVEHKITAEDEEAVEQVKRFWEAQVPEAYLEAEQEDSEILAAKPPWPHASHSEDDMIEKKEVTPLPRFRDVVSIGGGERTDEPTTEQDLQSIPSLTIAACFNGSRNESSVALAQRDVPVNASASKGDSQCLLPRNEPPGTEIPESSGVWDCFNRAMELQADCQLSNAAAMYEEVIRSCPDTLGPIRAACQLNRATCLVDLGQPNEAAVAFEEAAVFFSSRDEHRVEAARAHLGLAELYRTRDMHEEAIEHASLAWPRCVDPAMTREALVSASLSLLARGDTLSSVACLWQCGSSWANQMAEEISRDAGLKVEFKEAYKLEQDGAKVRLKSIVDGLESTSQTAWQTRLATN